MAMHLAVIPLGLSAESLSEPDQRNACQDKLEGNEIECGSLTPANGSVGVAAGL